MMLKKNITSINLHEDIQIFQEFIVIFIYCFAPSPNEDMLFERVPCSCVTQFTSMKSAVGLMHSQVRKTDCGSKICISQAESSKS
jgi:hypothetical protein